MENRLFRELLFYYGTPYGYTTNSAGMGSRELTRQPDTVLTDKLQRLNLIVFTDGARRKLVLLIVEDTCFQSDFAISWSSALPLPATRSRWRQCVSSKCNGIWANSIWPMLKAVPFLTLDIDRLQCKTRCLYFPTYLPQSPLLLHAAHTAILSLQAY
jgi:hypothetical protein